MESELLKEIVILFGLAIGVLLLCHRLRIPSIVGFLITGLACGPHGAAFVGETADVHTLAEIGIVLLLFTVGMEFSLKKLLEYKRFFFLGGGLQVLFTSLAGVIVATALQRPLGEAIFLGFLVSLSSTAIVLRTLEDRNETTTPHGRVILGILIFQDIAAIPMMLMTPYLAGVKATLNWEFLLFLFQGILVLGVVFFGAIKVVPRLMHIIARTRSRELFLLTTLTICFSVAWATASIGLQLSLGAFLAGLIISESEYRTEAIEDILPFRDIFTSFFFISMGMLLDLTFVMEEAPLILAITLGIMILKCAITSGATIITGMPLRTAIFAGLTLSQVGEFSFVLARSGMDAGIATDYLYQLFLSVAVITMALTPTLVHFAPNMVSRALQLPFPEKLKRGLSPLVEKAETAHDDHVLIVGYGLPGQILARSCKETKTPYVIVEIDADIIQEARQKREPIYFGDATHVSTLKHVHAPSARVIAILTNDPMATLKIVEQTRHLNQDAYIIVRSRYTDEMKPLYQLGADEVIPDEFGSAVEVFSRVLRKYQVAEEEIDTIISERRIEGFEMLHTRYKEPQSLYDIKTEFAELGVDTLKVEADSPLAGMPVGECHFREEYGAYPVMIRRGEAKIHHIKDETIIAAGDELVLVGPFTNLKRMIQEYV